MKQDPSFVFYRQRVGKVAMQAVAAMNNGICLYHSRAIDMLINQLYRYLRLEKCTCLGSRQATIAASFLGSQKSIHRRCAHLEELCLDSFSQAS